MRFGANHKSFVSLLSGMLKRDGMSDIDLAWVLDCNPVTVRRWLNGEGYPGRDNAMKLSRIDADFYRFFGILAFVGATAHRLKQKSKVAA